MVAHSRQRRSTSRLAPLLATSGCGSMTRAQNEWVSPRRPASAPMLDATHTHQRRWMIFFICVHPHTAHAHLFLKLLFSCCCFQKTAYECGYSGEGQRAAFCVAKIWRALQAATIFRSPGVRTTRTLRRCDGAAGTDSTRHECAERPKPLSGRTGRRGAARTAERERHGAALDDAHAGVAT